MLQYILSVIVWVYFKREGLISRHGDCHWILAKILHHLLCRILSYKEFHTPYRIWLPISSRVIVMNSARKWRLLTTADDLMQSCCIKTVAFLSHTVGKLLPLRRCQEHCLLRFQSLLLPALDAKWPPLNLRNPLCEVFWDNSSGYGPCPCSLPAAPPLLS